MAFLIGGANSAAETGFSVANSCRFNSDAYLHKQLGTATNNKKCTASLWVKPAVSDTRNTFISGGIDGGSYQKFRTANDSFSFYGNHASQNNLHIECNRKLRDPSAFYHVVIAFDSTQATSTNRIKLYVNGVQETSLNNATYPAEDAICYFNAASTSDIFVGAFGRQDDTIGEQGEGYFAEVCVIDGQALTPTSFGEYSETTPNLWIPKDVSGLTFGNNGFYLDFEDSSNLGNDVNGGTDLTAVSLAAADQATDTPTNNFATFNPLYNDTGGPISYSEGNTIATETANDWTSAHSTSGMYGGKFYWECKLASFSGGSASYIGAASSDYPATKMDSGSFLGQDSASIGYYASDGKVQKDGSDATYGDSYGAGDIIGMALDLDNNFAYWAKNGTWQNSGDPTSGATGTGGVSLPSGMTSGLILFSISPNESVMQANFGGSSGFAISSANSDGNSRGNFEYAVPSGYLSLCTLNLGSDGG